MSRTISKGIKSVRGYSGHAFFLIRGDRITKYKNVGLRSRVRMSMIAADLVRELGSSVNFTTFGWSVYYEKVVK